MINFSDFPYPVKQPDFKMDLHRMASLNPDNVIYCVWHHTGGRHHDSSAANINNYHRNTKGWAAIGYHFMIRWDGTVEVCRPLTKQGVHASKVNAQSIAVCMSGNFEEGPPTEDQLKSGLELAILITGAIPDIKHVRHKDVGATLCNGKLFPWGDFLSKHDRVINEPPKRILYHVQVGAFANHGNALRLADQLKELGYDVYIKKSEG